MVINDAFAFSDRKDASTTTTKRRMRNSGTDPAEARTKNSGNNPERKRVASLSTIQRT